MPRKDAIGIGASETHLNEAQPTLIDIYEFGKIFDIIPQDLDDPKAWCIASRRYHVGNDEGISVNISSNIKVLPSKILEGS